MAATPHLYNITIMLNRASETRRLTGDSHGAAVVGVLEQIAKKHADVYAYTIMPDHIHVLFGRDDPLEDVDEFAGRIKRRINKAYERRGWAKMRWLDGCTRYAVTLRGLKHARDYILANPVRGQLVNKASDWPFAGSPAPLPEVPEGPEDE